MKFMPNEQCYRAFTPTPKHPMGDIIRHLYHDGLKAVDDAGLLFKTREDARKFLNNFESVPGDAMVEMVELLKKSKSAIFDLLQSIEVPPNNISVWYDLSAVDFIGNAKNLMTKIDDELAKFEVYNNE